MAFLVSLSLLGLQIWVTSQLSTVLITLVAATFVCSLDGRYVSICVDFTFLCVILWLVSVGPELFSLREWVCLNGWWDVDAESPCTRDVWRELAGNTVLFLPAALLSLFIDKTWIYQFDWLPLISKLFSKISIQHVCAVHKEARRMSDPLQL